MARKQDKAYRATRRSRPLAVHERVAAYRKRMRAKGYKPVAFTSLQEVLAEPAPAATRH